MDALDINAVVDGDIIFGVVVDDDDDEVDVVVVAVVAVVVAVADGEDVSFMH